MGPTSSEFAVSVVIPVFNNADTLDLLIDRTVAVLERLGVRFELILIDDGSSDDSAEVLRRRAAADPRVQTRALARNFGGQAALCAGFELARGERVVCLDADLENDPEDIPRLLEGLDRGFELACGVRTSRRRAGWRRRLPSVLLNWYVRRRTGSRVRDIGCGMRAMEARIVRNLGIEGEARRLLTPLLLRRARSVIEIPIHYVPRSDRSGHSFLSLLSIAFDYYLLTAHRPFLVTGIVSLAMFGAGLLLGGFSAVADDRSGILVALLLCATGFTTAVLSLAGEYAQRIYQLEQGLPFYEFRREESEALRTARERDEERAP